MLANVVAMEQQVYGSLYLPYIGSALFVIQISGLLMRKFFPNLDIEVLVKKAVKLL